MPQQFLLAVLTDFANYLSVIMVVLFNAQFCIFEKVINHILIKEISSFQALSHKRNPLMADFGRKDIDEETKLREIRLSERMFLQLLRQIVVESIVGQKRFENGQSLF
jgi:hypothetical protein